MNALRYSLLLSSLILPCGCGSSGSSSDNGVEDTDVSVTFGIAGTSVVEATIQVIAQVQLSDVADEDVVIDFSTAGSSATVGVDFTVATASPITIPVGSLTENIVVEVQTDTIGELDEIVRINIVPVNADVGPNGTFTLKILDDDAVQLSESEPNDDVPTADVVGDVEPGRAYVISGTTLVTEFDVFQLTAIADTNLFLVLDPDSAVSEVVLNVLDELGNSVFVFDDDLPGTTVAAHVQVVAGQVFHLAVTVEGAGTDYTLSVVGLTNDPSGPDGGSGGPDELSLAARGFGGDLAGLMEWRAAEAAGRD